MGTGHTSAVNHHRAKRTGEGLGDVNTGRVQQGSRQDVVNTQVVLINDDLLQQSLNLFSSSIIDVDSIFTIQGRERNFQVILLVHFIGLSLNLVACLLDTVDVYIEILALLLTDLVTS